MAVQAAVTRYQDEMVAHYARNSGMGGYNHSFYNGASVAVEPARPDPEMEEWDRKLAEAKARNLEMDAYLKWILGWK